MRDIRERPIAAKFHRNENIFRLTGENSRNYVGLGLRFELQLFLGFSNKISLWENFLLVFHSDEIMSK